MELLIDIGFPIPLLLFILVIYNGNESFKIFNTNISSNLYSSQGVYSLIVVLILLAIPFHYYTGVFRANYLLDLSRILLSLYLSNLVYVATLKGVTNNQLNWERRLNILCFIMIIICLFEILPGIGPQIHRIYEIISSPFYDGAIDIMRSTNRNLGLFGRRPLFLTSEPSHVAKLSVNLTYILILQQIYKYRPNFIGAILFAIASTLIIQSPITLISIILIGGAILIFSMNTLYRWIIIMISSLSFAPLINTLINLRTDFELVGADTRLIIKYAWQNSGLIRAIIPYLISTEIISTNFIYFGLGLDAKYFAQIKFAWLSVIPEYGVLGNNSLFKLFIILGLYGLVILVVLLFLMYKSLGSCKIFLLFLLYIVTFSFTNGSIDIYLMPSSIALLLGVNNGLKHNTYVELGIQNNDSGILQEEMEN